MIYVNTISLIELLICGILCLQCTWSCDISAEYVNCFKNRLDNFWKDQEIIYNFRADIHYGTGNRSEVTV